MFNNVSYRVAGSVSVLAVAIRVTAYDQLGFSLTRALNRGLLAMQLLPVGSFFPREEFLL